MADVVESKEQVLIRYRDKELRGCTIKKAMAPGHLAHRCRPDRCDV